MGNRAGRKYARPAWWYYSNASNERLFTSDGRGAVSTIKNFGHRRLIKNFCPTKARMCVCTSSTRVFFFFFFLPRRQILHGLYDGYRLRFRRDRFAMKEMKLDESN